ncbi:C1 family peptidase [Zeaxanthinibacter sp. PT1]|uniref:C1 family peptidase n=1 Tax=Zeaxanthinibacter TaxID=561554 RepID=UPI00234993D6|nr:C1 family peptidase [Zeaxanthinibacter sp. PT1]MDC6350495.1 C1 family peptidase [Zeaxanthinibacter sp. PT1]
MKAIISLLVVIFSINNALGQKPTGLLFDDEAYASTPMKARNLAFQDVVSDIPMASLKAFVPEIRDQGGYGTCVGWSSAYYGRTMINARQKNLKDKARISENTFAPVFVYLNANRDDDYNCQGGAYIDKALKVMVDEGTPYLRDYDVMCDTAIPDSIKLKAQENRLRDYVRLFQMDESDEVKLESVKRSLTNGNPVIIGFKVENSFYSASNVFEPDSLGITGGHAMCVVGYDDEKYGGAFEIVNSWGNEWGNDGFIWVRYPDFINYTPYAYEMIPPVAPEKKETKKLAGKLDLRLRDGTTMDVDKLSGDYGESVLGFQDVVADSIPQSIGDYRTEGIFPINTRYRMYANVSTPSYVYVIGADKDTVNLLFPNKKNISPFISEENTSVVVPKENYYFRLNKMVPSDYTIVIFSLEQIDIDAAIEKLQNLQGTLTDRLYITFKDQLIPREEILLQDDQMGFKAEFVKGSMALMVLDIRRS